MDPTHGWERNKAQTRLALANAAARLFRAQGYSATTVDDIANEAGCSARTFFRYFGAKEDVLFVDTGEMVADFQRLIAAPVPGLTRWDQIRLGISTTISRIAEPSSGIGDITIATWLSEPAIAKRFSQVTAELERSMLVALAEERGVDPDGDLAVQFLARSATAGYLSAFRVHVHTGRALEPLLEEVFRLIEDRTALERHLRGTPSAVTVATTDGD